MDDEDLVVAVAAGLAGRAAAWTGLANCAQIERRSDGGGGCGGLARLGNFVGRCPGSRRPSGGGPRRAAPWCRPVRRRSLLASSRSRAFFGRRRADRRPSSRRKRAAWTVSSVTFLLLSHAQGLRSPAVLGLLQWGTRPAATRTRLLSKPPLRAVVLGKRTPGPASPSAGARSSDFLRLAQVGFGLAGS